MTRIFEIAYCAIELFLLSMLISNSRKLSCESFESMVNGHGQRNEQLIDALSGQPLVEIAYIERRNHTHIFDY